MLDPDPLHTPCDYGILPIDAYCADVSRWRTVWHHAVPDRHRMTDWLSGLVIGLTLGIPLGTTLAIILGRVDRWLDVRWQR